MSERQKDALSYNSKIFGDQITDSAIEKMDNMGAGIEQAGAQLKAIQEGARYAGLDASKFAQDFVSNLDWAQKNVNFKDGIDGIRKMTEKSEVLKINMQSIMAAAEKMNNVQGAIQSSAKMQMLGGNFARNFFDPMRVMYESQSDPEALFNRIIDSVKGMSTFNMKTGQAETNYYGRASLKAASEATGIDYNQLLQATQSKARLNALGTQMNGSLTEEQQTAIANRAQLNTKTGRYEVSWYDKNGATTPKDISQMTAADIKAMTDSAKQTEDINGNVYQITNFTKTLPEMVNAFKDTFLTKTWKDLGTLTDKITAAIQGIIDFFKGELPWWKKTLMWIGGILVVSGTARGLVGKLGGWIGKQTIGRLLNWSVRGAGAGLSRLWGGLGRASFGRATGNLGTRTTSAFAHGNINGFTGSRLEAIQRARNIRNIRAARIAEETEHTVTRATEAGNVASHGRMYNALFKNEGWAKMGKYARIGRIAGGAFDALGVIEGGREAINGMQNEQLALNNLHSSGGIGNIIGDRNKSNAIMNIVQADRDKKAGIGMAYGSALGIAANFIPIVGPALGLIISTAAPFIGKAVGLITGKKASTVINSEQSRDRANSYWYETSKFGQKDLAKYDTVGQATIKSADILSSIYQILFNAPFNKEGRAAMNRKTDRDTIASGDTAALKEFDENDHFRLFHPSTWFGHWGKGYATGGIVHANSGTIVHGNYEQGDRELIAANSGEMILNKKQQGALFSFINKLYDSPTEIAKRTSALNAVGYKGGNMGGTFNLNLSGTIKLDAGGQKYDFKALMNDASFVKELSNMIIKQMSKNMNGKFDKNNPVSRTNSYTYRRGVGYNNV
jgi:hypothetical protein